MPEHSEVAHIQQRIQEEYEAAQAGLFGLAQGVSQHQFISQKMEHMYTYHKQLVTLVGSEEAAKIISEIE
jgi:hypothetical protein